MGKGRRASQGDPTGRRAREGPAGWAGREAWALPGSELPTGVRAAPRAGHPGLSWQTPLSPSLSPRPLRHLLRRCLAAGERGIRTAFVTVPGQAAARSWAAFSVPPTRVLLGPDGAGCVDASHTGRPFRKRPAGRLKPPVRRPPPQQSQRPRGAHQIRTRYNLPRGPLALRALRRPLDTRLFNSARPLTGLGNILKIAFEAPPLQRSEERAGRSEGPPAGAPSGSGTTAYITLRVNPLLLLD